MIKFDQNITIDIFHPEDAEGVAELFKSVYGEGYPVKLVYNPPELISAFKARENVPAIARTAKGEIIGYCGLYRSSPNPGLYEGGQGLVSLAHRRSNVGTRVVRYAMEDLARQIDVDGVFGEAVCNHTYMQEVCVNMNLLETALEVDLMPAEAYAKEKSAPGRVAALPTFRIYKPKPHEVHLPAVYRKQLEFLYIGLDDPRTFSVSSTDIPPKAKTTCKAQIFDFAKVARLAFSATGSDFDQILTVEEAGFAPQNIVITQVWLRLSEPWVGKIVAILKKKGYFFGGLLPRWFGEDGLLMQKIVGRPNWDEIHLYSDRAKQILEFVKADWEETVK